MTTIERQQLIAEQFIREHIRKRITHKLQEQFRGEQKLRKVVRQLIEAETGTEEPSQNTGINVLADLLQKIIPTIEDAYKMLTTSKEQRDSFRNHIVHAVENTLRPIDVSTAAETAAESVVYEIDGEVLLEKVAISLDPQADGKEAQSIEGEFIDIEGEEGEGDEFIQIDDQNETGRNFAATTFKNVEKQMVDAYDMLADEEDQKLFYDYLITNLLLYFDKFEDELESSLPDISTDEYEEEKEGDLGSEEGGEEELGGEEEPAEGGGGPSGDE